ncbi:MULTISPECIES: Ycf66 family protein [unclassified Microcoleus]|uniref:Ycf66 family protein n=1 Tax=unclassified Microcoleus TaxID=2642155 RepID=UPI002FCEEF5C
MLAYFLALAVGLGSFSIYMAAFFFPEVHRKSDFTWSGVGLFYALILWACAGRITGALLLGQMAGVAMLGWFAWETLTLRRLVTPVAEQTPIPQSVSLPGAAGGLLAGLFTKKQEPAAKKPKFVRSPKPKTDVVPAPAVDKGEVKLDEQPAIPPIAEIIAENSIDSTAESTIGPDLKIPDRSAPAIAEIPVFSVETPAAETSPTPAELASNFTPLPLPLEISEIPAAASVEPAEAPPERQQQPEADDFDEMETEWRTAVKESQAAAAAAPTPAKPAKKSGGFASLFGNIKNSLGGMLGRGAGKNKSDATPQTPKPSATPDSIAPESKITATPAPGIDQILESELAEVAAEVAAESSNTAVETSQAVPFPRDVEAMAELMAAEIASFDKIGESPIDERSSTDTQTTQFAQQTPPAAAGEPEAAAADLPEAQAPAASIEMTVVEMVSVAPVEMEASGEPELIAQVETVSVTVISIESTGEELSSEGEQPELIRPNPPDPDLVETAKPVAESKSENVSGEDKPSS